MTYILCHMDNKMAEEKFSQVFFSLSNLHNMFRFSTKTPSIDPAMVHLGTILGGLLLNNNKNITRGWATDGLITYWFTPKMWPFWCLCGLFRTRRFRVCPKVAAISFNGYFWQCSLRAKTVVDGNGHDFTFPLFEITHRKFTELHWENSQNYTQYWIIE